MPLWSSTTDFPVLNATTGKQELIRLLLKEAHNAPNIHAIIFRLNNTTSMSSITDIDVQYDPADTFAASV